MTRTFNDANIVTRVDTRETEDGTEVRLFHKRVKLFAFGADDANEEQLETVAEFLAAKPRTSEEVEEYLTSEPGDDEGDENEGGSVVPQKYRERYGVTQRCGDDVAEYLSGYVTLPRALKNGKQDIDGGLDRAKLREVAVANNLVEKLDFYENREDKRGNPLNGGLIRMNISNILRGMVRRGERVVIGTKVWEAREVAKPKRTKKAAKAK